MIAPKGTITWVPLVSADVWRIKLIKLTVNGYPIISGAVDAAVDTGSTSIVGPPEDIQTGTITWVPLVSADVWRIKLIKLTVNGYPIISGAVDAAVDTGSTSIVGPPEDIQTIHGLIGASDDGAIDCSTIPDLPAISFKFGDVEFVLRGSDYVIQVLMVALAKFG
ncbi:hypothetical protein COOONC_11956 [Cooperia oncophora]